MPDSAPLIFTLHPHKAQTDRTRSAVRTYHRTYKINTQGFDFMLFLQHIRKQTGIFNSIGMKDRYHFLLRILRISVKRVSQSSQRALSSLDFLAYYKLAFPAYRKHRL